MAPDPLDSLVGVEFGGVLSLPFVGWFCVFEQVLSKLLNENIFLSKSYVCLCCQVEVGVGELPGVVVSHLTGQILAWISFHTNRAPETVGQKRTGSLCWWAGRMHYKIPNAIFPPGARKEKLLKVLLYHMRCIALVL